MFPNNLFFEPMQSRLVSAMAGYLEPATSPLPCDRWLARSCLQKAIRRGEAGIAQRAFANLLAHDPRSAWRHLVVIALEDVGVPAFDLVARVTLVARDRKLRFKAGGDWRIGSFLVRKMAESVHCQAVCDLLLRVTNDPAWERDRALLLETPVGELAEILLSDQTDLPSQGMAVLALGGGLAGGQRYHDPALVFEVLADAGYSGALIEIARGAWKTSRNPMAMLFPLVRRAWDRRERSDVAAEDIPEASMIAGIPEYAADQFTRVGRRVIGAYVRADAGMRAILDACGIHPSRHAAIVGDLIFLTEGTCLRDRVAWLVGEELTDPRRALPGVFVLASGLEKAVAHLAANWSQISVLRRRYLTSEPGSLATGRRL